MQAHFYEDLGRGKIGEQIFQFLLKKMGYEVQDLSNDRMYQKQGVDFRITNETKDLLIDVKTDYVMYRTGNIFLELEDGPRLGWAKKTKADLIFYIDHKNQIVYLLKWEDCLNIIDSLRQVSFYNQDGIKMRGALLPITQLHQIRYQIIDLGDW